MQPNMCVSIRWLVPWWEARQECPCLLPKLFLFTRSRDFCTSRIAMSSECRKMMVGVWRDCLNEMRREIGGHKERVNTIGDQISDYLYMCLSNPASLFGRQSRSVSLSLYCKGWCVRLCLYVSVAVFICQILSVSVLYARICQTVSTFVAICFCQSLSRCQIVSGDTSQYARRWIVAADEIDELTLLYIIWATINLAIVVEFDIGSWPLAHDNTLTQLDD